MGLSGKTPVGWVPAGLPSGAGRDYPRQKDFRLTEHGQSMELRFRTFRIKTQFSNGLQRVSEASPSMGPAKLPSQAMLAEINSVAFADPAAVAVPAAAVAADPVVVAALVPAAFAVGAAASPA